jgi:hypothetical protein
MANQVKPFQHSIDDAINKENNSTILDLNWSLGPLSLWMSLIGVDLPPRHRNPLVRWLAILFNIVLHLYLVIFLGCNLHDISHSMISTFSFTHLWNLIADYANFTVHAIGVHLSLLIVTRVKWITFWPILTQTTSCISRTSKNSSSVDILLPQATASFILLKLRRFSYLGLVYIFIQVNKRHFKLVFGSNFIKLNNFTCKNLI